MTTAQAVTPDIQSAVQSVGEAAASLDVQELGSTLLDSVQSVGEAAASLDVQELGSTLLDSTKDFQSLA